MASEAVLSPDLIDQCDVASNWVLPSPRVMPLSILTLLFASSLIIFALLFRHPNYTWLALGRNSCVLPSPSMTPLCILTLFASPLIVFTPLFGSPNYARPFHSAIK